MNILISFLFSSMIYWLFRIVLFSIHMLVFLINWQDLKEEKRLQRGVKNTQNCTQIISIWTRGLAFSFCTRPHKLCSQSCQWRYKLNLGEKEKEVGFEEEVPGCLSRKGPQLYWTAALNQNPRDLGYQSVPPSHFSWRHWGLQNFGDFSKVPSSSMVHSAF